jgi:hypothetical protein
VYQEQQHFLAGAVYSPFKMTSNIMEESDEVDNDVVVVVRVDDDDGGVAEEVNNNLSRSHNGTLNGSS